ncbi:hypothetical protein D3C81_918550 [compost metagenome]
MPGSTFAIMHHVFNGRIEGTADGDESHRSTSKSIITTSDLKCKYIYGFIYLRSVAECKIRLKGRYCS